MTHDLRSNQNRFINSLPQNERALINSRIRAVPLPLHTVLCASEETPSHAFFLTSGLASVVTSMPDGATVEVGVMGREGIAGSLHLLGPTVVSTHCMMQLEGTGFSIPFHVLATLFAESSIIRTALLEFVQHQTVCLGQIAACHRLHLGEERLARWLLMVQDRIGSDLLYLTQEFLGNMLGSRRTSVTKAAGALEQAGAIEFRRGHIRILDRQRLVAAACVCYPIIEQLFLNLYGTRCTPSVVALEPRRLAM